MSALRLGLGTVQFGTDYGVSNARGRVPEDEVAALLAEALDAGIALIDTAPAYGDAEAVLGRALPRDRPVRLITKTLGAADMAADPDAIERHLDASLARLGRASVDGLLVHHGHALLGPHGERHLAALERIRADGRAGKIGVSIYDSGELDGILEVFAPEIVQLPVNVADQRMIASGTISWLAAAGIEVHARSLFLQGLLLTPPDALPAPFAPVRPKFAAIAAAAARDGLTPLEFCLAFAFANPDIAVPLVGVAGLDELRQILSAARKAAEIAPETTGLGIDDSDWVDPSRWKARGLV